MEKKENMTHMQPDVAAMARAARKASPALAASSNAQRNDALARAAAALRDNSAAIFAANDADMRASEAEGLSSALLKRLKFDAAKLDVLLEGIDALIAMDDPLRRTLYAMELDRGLELYRVTCPIGVTGIIFESRPDALVQISALCLKSGNCVLLKGGREAASTNRALFDTIYQAALAAGLPEGCMGLMESREEIAQMLKLDGDIDLIIPRGSNEFVRYIMDNSRIPVMGHADGVCHLYAHDDCDITQAVPVIVDSKTQYVAVCNALETLLVHRDAAQALLPQAAQALRDKGVRLIGCPRTREIIEAEPATEADWDTEYLDYTLSIRIVDSLEEAVAHINTHGSHHTDGILTTSEEAKRAFVAGVDSADVFINCSTRFSDGFCYGLGAEIGIATGRIHARGPVGLEGLLIYKYVLAGDGQTKGEYGEGGRKFTHVPLEGESPY